MLKNPQIMNNSQQAIGTKLALISIALIMAILSVGMVGISALKSLNNNVNAIVDVAANKVQLGEKIQQDLLKITRAEKILLPHKPKRKWMNMQSLSNRHIVI